MINTAVIDRIVYPSGTNKDGDANGKTMRSVKKSQTNMEMKTVAQSKF